MAGHKRRLDDGPFAQTSKKTKLSSDKRDSVPSTSAMTLEEVDFPRGGGTTLTPLEVKTIRAEAVREADQELFVQTQVKRKQRKSDIKAKATEAEMETKDAVRIEHLNYKRLIPGMRVLGQVMSIQPLAIVVSLPNQLFAHVPITQITSQLTERLESTNDIEGGELDDDTSESSTQVPDLTNLFYVGQYVRAVVISAHTPGATDVAGLGRVRDDAIKASRRIELSLIPAKVNTGVRKVDLGVGYSLSAAVHSVEDHGYILDIGVSGISGFLSFREAHKGGSEGSRLQVGALVDVSVVKMSSNGRICTLTNDPEVLVSSSISEVNNVSSVLPGSLVQSLVTAVVPDGLNLRILGFFDATADEFHLSNTHKSLKIGQKVKARVLYNLPGTTPPRFVVTLAEHHIKLQPKSISEGQLLYAAFPVGAVLDSVKVRRVEAERGLLVEIQPNQEGFVHISHVSDEHIPTLSVSSGPWKVNTFHKARVIGYHPFDGILQLSLRSSVLEQRFLQAGQVHVGEILKGIVKQLTDSALFVSISGNVDGVIWPVHYADIPLKHPSKKFKVGGSIKCRVRAGSVITFPVYSSTSIKVLTVDPERNRIVLTAKKTLLDTTFPILSSFSDAKVGLLTHAVIFRVTDKYLMVEFFNNTKAVVPAREASETGAKLTDVYAPGKVIKVRIISVHPEAQRIVASIRQATSLFTSSVTDISGILIGDMVEGVATQLHELNVVLSLKPSNVRALISFSGLARHWNTTVPDLKTSLKPGASIASLIVDTDVPSLKIEGFQWFVNDTGPYEGPGLQSESSDQSDSEENVTEKRKRKQCKKIEMDVTADMQTKLPDSNADFERMLLGSPNSSYLWIQYMSFQLQLSEIDKARAIGKRAIKTIHFREEQEKLNVWIALLNLENVYGTDATMEVVFKDAVLHNDSKTIHLRLAAIFDESQKYEKAEEQYKRTCKKFGQSSKVWTLSCDHYLRRGLAEDARRLLSRSLQSLEKRKHLKTITKFAQLEYKLGDAERGRTIFEGIVDSHPKRWDIWSVYMDMEAGKGDIQHLRNLFGHVLAIKMTSHKAKTFFKKWLDLERKLGDGEGVTVVKQKAIEWTQTAAEAA
ncbi:hypothetical protein J3R83DRAFT_6412 [Lanmaoa asiatica]|nr:hypothetical protein J3R83DRAFT_6412 [Lanmaoa asiatica]